jgi:hypothetical protein
MMQTGLGFAGGVDEGGAEECHVVADGQDFVIGCGGCDKGHPPADHDSVGWLGYADAPSQRVANESNITRIVKSACG